MSDDLDLRAHLSGLYELCKHQHEQIVSLTNSLEAVRVVLGQSEPSFDESYETALNVVNAESVAPDDDLLLFSIRGKIAELDSKKA